MKKRYIDADALLKWYDEKRAEQLEIYRGRGSRKEKDLARGKIFALDSFYTKIMESVDVTETEEDIPKIHRVRIWFTDVLSGGERNNMYFDTIAAPDWQDKYVTFTMPAGNKHIFMYNSIYSIEIY